MLFKRLILIAGLSVFLTACSTENAGDNNFFSLGKESNTAIGVRYLLGRGVDQNNEKAFYYFSRAAQLNDPFAQNELGYLYAAGKGTSQSYQKAFYWYEKAALQGLASAQYNVGFFYLHGLGVERDKEKAMVWFDKSAQKGFLPAVKMIDNQ